MAFRLKTRSPTGLQTSPWVILGSTAILLVAVMVLAIANTNREKRYMAQVLKTKGAALIQAVEAGARTGMTGMMWRGQEVQRLLEETARLPDVLFMAVVDRDGRVVADSDTTRIGKPFREEGPPLRHLGPDQVEDWELVEGARGQRIFEVHRHFHPLEDPMRFGGGSMAAMMQRHGRMLNDKEDWFQPLKRQERRPSAVTFSIRWCSRPYCWFWASAVWSPCPGCRAIGWPRKTCRTPPPMPTKS